jgi:choloylglycine hydrolase
MRRIGFILLFGIAFIFSITAQGYCCTAFSLGDDDELYAAKNFDWSTGDGLICTNKRGLTKTALGTPEDNPATWQSEYGSISFTHWGYEFPTGGINEAGLVVELLAELSGRTEAPQPDDRPFINPLEWVQYQLDTAATVDEVIASDSVLRIIAGDSVLRVPLRASKRAMAGHYFVSDRQGNSACIELLDGKMAAYTGDRMPVKAITNHLYKKSLRFLSLFQGFCGFLPVNYSGEASLSRFVQAADMLRKYDNETTASAHAYAFDVLNETAQSSTRWSIVYDISNLHVDFITDNNTENRSFDMSSFDFSCKTPALVLDVNASLEGDIFGIFQEYTTEINKQLIEKTWPEFFPSISLELIDSIARYPESFVCVE